jgi:uracil-DNA glycosylase
MTASLPRIRFQQLLAAPPTPGVFNPWRDDDADNSLAHNDAAARLARLEAHLATTPAQVLIGEASGYQGCRVSGIPFTSERLILAGDIPRVASSERLSARVRPWSEPSATTVWKTLHELGIAQDTVLWNAFPWHPFHPHQPLSNRTPTHMERERGMPVLRALLGLFPHTRVFAVGRHAEQALQEVGRAAVALRHPSMGGATLFRDGLRAALR